MQILKLLALKGSLSYTEIMSSIKLDPVRDAGKFVYHLKSLIEAGLVAMDEKTKKYAITELGEMSVNFSRDIEEYFALKRGKLFVRTSRLAIEKFDRRKIVSSLMNEANVPLKLAQEIAAEAEEKLMQFKITYLTAPLIRELVNAILVERKLEEYRHRLTRLGMPVYDVTQLLKFASERMLNVDAVKDAAGASVMEEYALLNCLPRDVADSHLSGLIHIDNLSYWILKPNEIQHDVRFFIKNGLPSIGAPKNFESALTMIQNIFKLSAAEISGEQSFDMFNIFLAPFIAGTSSERVKEVLHSFLVNLRQDIISNTFKPGLSLGFELFVPSFLYDVKALGPGGKAAGVYGDYADEASLILKLAVEAALEASLLKPLFSPRFIFKLREGALKSSSLKDQLLKIHELAAKHRLPYFAFIKENSKANYTASGARLDEDWTGDWELDCVRTGSMDTIFLNLPRIAYESRKSDDKFLELLSKSLKTILEAFEAKRKAVSERMQQSLLPLLSGGWRGLKYFNDENAVYAISFVGLNEAVAAHTGSDLLNESSLKFALKIMREMISYADSSAQELGMRLAVSQRPGDEAASRLAELDLEKYGLATAVVEGTKDHPYYTDMTALPPSAKASLEKRVSVESELQALTNGGHLTSICLTPSVQSPEDLAKLTEQLCLKGLKFFTYTSNYSYCRKCDRSFIGRISKCEICGSSSLLYFGRSSAFFTPLTLWPDAKRLSIDKHVCYSPSLNKK
jgi:ribonucleoside-triphosphate reductase